MWALDWQPLDQARTPAHKLWNGPLARVLGRAGDGSATTPTPTATTDEGSNKGRADGGGATGGHAVQRPGAELAGSREWYRVRNAASGSGTAELDIYDEIGWFGVSADRLISELKQLDADTIRVNINSPGGDMWDGIAIFNALVDHPARIEVKIDALAASAASVIAQAGDHVAMAGGSQMMIHDAWGLCGGNASDMEAMALLLNQASDNLAQLYAGTTGQDSPEVWRTRMRAESWYNADEAVAAGLADEALPVQDRRKRRPEDAFDLTVFNYAGRSHAPAPKIERPAARAGGAATVPEGGARPGLLPAPGVPGDDTAGAAPGDGGDNPVDDPGALVLAAWGDADVAVPESALLAAADAAGLGTEAERVRDELDPFHFDVGSFEAVMDAADRNAPNPYPTDRPQPAPDTRQPTIDIDVLLDAIKEGALP